MQRKTTPDGQEAPSAGVTAAKPESDHDSEPEPTTAPPEDVGRDHRQIAQLIAACVLMGATGVLLFVIGVWALTFDGVISRELTRALGGLSLTSGGTIVLVFGIIMLVCLFGILIGSGINRWVSLVARLVAVVAATVTALTGVWLVGSYPAWAITFTVLAAGAVYTLTEYERALSSPWPWAPLRAYLAKVFALNTKGVNVPRGVAVAGFLLITLEVCVASHFERYFLSVAFSLLFVSLSDPGGDYLSRLGWLAVVGVVGSLLTALGYGIAGDAWGFAVLALFVVTVLSGLAIRFGLQVFVASLLLNIWLLITLSAAIGLPSVITVRPWNQALAWLIGSGISIVLMSGSWLVRGRSSQPSPLPEVPADLPPINLTRPIVLFVLIRAIAVSGAAAIAFGLHVTNADWMPIATLIAMKTTLEQSTLRSVQRLVGTALGAAIAATLLVTVSSFHSLEEIVILLAGIGITIFAVNYTFYAAALAGAVLIAMDLPHPSNLDAEGRRIFFTFAGVAIAIVVTGLATLLQKRKSAAAVPKGS